MKKHIKRNRIFGSVVGIAVFACLFLFQELSDNTLTATVPPIPEGNIIVEFLDVGAGGCCSHPQRTENDADRRGK